MDDDYLLSIQVVLIALKEIVVYEFFNGLFSAEFIAIDRSTFSSSNLVNHWTTWLLNFFYTKFLIIDSNIALSDTNNNG